MPKMQVNVQTHHTYLNRTDEIEQQLKDAGMDVQDEIKTLGNFSGFADDDKIDILKSIPGVASVDITGDAGLPPKNDYTISK